MNTRFVAVFVAFFCMIGSVAFSQGPGAGADEGLVGYWSFDQGQGDVLRDQRGQGNDGQIHGAKWVKSGRGYALWFNGKTDYVDCGDGASLDITGPITVQAWMQPRLDNRGEAGVAGKSFDSYALTLRTSTFSKNSPRFHISSGDNSISVPAGIVGSWMHIVATFDGATMRTYRNGQEI